MKIHLLGAAGTVTGSAYLVETSRARVLIDFGQFQGGAELEKLNVYPEILRSGKLDAVLITHGHLDHTGRLPLLTHNGYHGPLWATEATREMAQLILEDSVRLQASEIMRENKRRQRAALPPLEPPFTSEDVAAVIAQFRPVPYQEFIEVAPGIRARWAEAGHMLGSASIQLEADGHRVVFSGDIGPVGAPVLRDAEPFSDADLVFLESTYGDRDHRSLEETLKEFAAVVRESVAAGGKILVPAFAIGRAQQLIYHLNTLFDAGAIPRFPIHLDSPMAIEAQAIMLRHPELFDEEATALHQRGELRRDFTGVQIHRTAEQSRALNDLNGPRLIIAGSGMCNGGRILHHLKHNLWNPTTHLIICGYQSYDSIGRRIIEGAKHIRILGDEIAVKATAHTLGGFSAHAGQTELLKWLAAVARKKPQVVLTHGEDRQRAALTEKIRAQFALPATSPTLGETIHL